MSASGAAPRATLDLRIRVWGMGSDNQPFHQNATAQNASITGACINGLEHEVKVGDVIGVQFETKKARCKVVWVMEATGLKKVQVGVQLVVDQECPWISQLPVEMRSNLPAPTADNRRRFQRHKISFPLEFRDERVNTPMRVNATDISGNGCYVETAMPLAVATVLNRPGTHHFLRHGSHARSRSGHGYRVHWSARRLQKTLPGAPGQAGSWPFQARSQRAGVALRTQSHLPCVKTPRSPVESASSTVSGNRITESYESL